MPIQVKICGINSVESADAAVHAGADFVGLVFHARSQRRIDPQRARSLSSRLRGRARIVALLADADDAAVAAVMADANPDFIQLHGRESVARVSEIRSRTGVGVIKAISVADTNDISAAIPYQAVADMLMFDAKAPADATREGGHGAAFDWQLLRGRTFSRPWLLAGGLNPENVARAIGISGASGVDVSSGVETAPGVKSPDLIRTFIDNARNAQFAERNTMNKPNTLREGPDATGHFGAYGGRFVAETLMPLVLDLEKAYTEAKNDPDFHTELNGLLKHYVGRPNPLYFAERLTNHLGGAKIYLKREDLNHTGAHKINNCLGQILLARRMGKTRIIAETGAGQHGVATATVAARFGYPCVVYMGAVDIERQKPNVFRMNLMGAEVRGVTSGSKTLKDAMNEALRDWVANVHDTFYIIGSAAGPHPYPEMVRDFQCVIGNEIKKQTQDAEGRLPDLIVACVGGGSNAIGTFHPFLDDSAVEIHGIEASGEGVDTHRHAATLTKGTPGVLHGARSYLLQDKDGQITEAHSISAGLDYPGVGPEHSWLKDQGRVKYFSATDKETMAAFTLLCKVEGIIPALESAHALAHIMRVAPQMAKDKVIVMTLSGRGDKDVFTAAAVLGEKI